MDNQPIPDEAGRRSISLRRLVPLLLAAVLATLCTWAWARSDSPPRQGTTLRLDRSKPGAYFEPGAVGLSSETSELETNHLAVGHSRLVRLMQLLGRSVLRVAGGSVDNSWWTSRGEAAPAWATNTVTPADLSAVDRLLAATNWRVLLGLNLGHFEPERAANEVHYAEQIFGKRLLGVEIGNEPNAYGHPRVGLRAGTYGASEYRGELTSYIESVRAVAPGVAVYGPDLTQSMTWLPELSAVLQEFAEVTQHYYPVNVCPSTSGRPSPTGSITPAPARTELLSATVRSNEDAFLASLGQVQRDAGRAIRLGETNSDSCTAPSPSPHFASALWALDWVLRAASSGVRAFNFHTRLHACTFLESPVCAPSEDAAKAGGLIAQPEFYGLLAARQLEGGRFVPVALEASDPTTELTAWATVSRDGTTRIVLDNLATTGAPQAISVPTAGYDASQQVLRAPSVEASTGVELGNASITRLGRWRPRPVVQSGRSMLRVLVRPSTAVLLTLRRRKGARRAGVGA